MGVRSAALDAVREGALARHYSPAALRDAWRAARERLDELVFGLTDAQWQVPHRAGVNPPAWEAAHVAWFAEFWILRAPHRVDAQGFVHGARPPVNAGPDDLLDSARIAHADRWKRALPDRVSLRGVLDRQLDACLAALERTDASDAALYFYRLSLAHEDMHNEAFAWLRATLGLPAPSGAVLPRFAARPAVRVPGDAFVLGFGEPTGFAFDNEIPTRPVTLSAFEIDATPVTAGAFAEFVEAGGYETVSLWSGDAGAWRERGGRKHPERWRREPSGAWEHRWFDRWVPLDPAQPVIHVNAYEAEAFARWMGRRLPSAAEWERAASAGRIDWGAAVWEWTADAFAPYPGFERGPYRDYSAPWFHTHRELRGGAFATAARMHHPRYRNFFMAERGDVFAGVRTAKSI